jgi:hypothetical protein
MFMLIPFSSSSSNLWLIFIILGGPGKEHELIWHEVVENHPLVCVECGQVFKLRKMAPQVDPNPNPEDFMGH